MNPEPATPTPLERARARFDRDRDAMERALEDIDDSCQDFSPRAMSRLVAVAEMERGLCERSALALIAEIYREVPAHSTLEFAKTIGTMLTQAPLLR
jgi:hypothetical protein